MQLSFGQAQILPFTAEPVRAITLTCVAHTLNSTRRRLAITDNAVLLSQTVTVRTVVWPLFSDIIVANSTASSSVVGGDVGFMLTTEGGMNATLIADQQYRLLYGPAFSSNGTLVMIGDAQATVYGVNASDGALLIQLPTYSAVCPGPKSCSGANGYKRISIKNPERMGVIARNMSGVFAFDAFQFSGDSEQYYGGGAVSCPPYCPGPEDVVGVGGAYFAVPCVGYLTGLACLDPTRASECGFGNGYYCTQCPEGTICPGGERAWPMKGEDLWMWILLLLLLEWYDSRCSMSYFLNRLLELERVHVVGVQVSSSCRAHMCWLGCEVGECAVVVALCAVSVCVVVSRCDVSMLQCSQHQPICGEGRRNGSYGCSQCSEGYYPSMEACQPCPANSIVGKFFAVIICTALLIVVIAYFCRVKYGGVFSAGVMAGFELLFWMLTALQLLSSVSMEVACSYVCHGHLCCAPLSAVSWHGGCNSPRASSV